MIEHRPEERGCALRQEIVDGVESRLHVLVCLFHIQQIGIDRLEQCRIQLHRLKDHLAIRQQTGTDYLDPRQGRRSVENPKRGVIEVAACDEPFVGLVDGRERAGGRGQKLHLRVSLADLVQPGA